MHFGPYLLKVWNSYENAMIQRLSGRKPDEEANMNKYVENPSAWTAPVIPEKIPQGDVPGDKIEIGEDHINKANLIFKLTTVGTEKRRRRPQDRTDCMRWIRRERIRKIRDRFSAFFLF